VRDPLHELARLAGRSTISDARILRRQLSDLRKSGPPGPDPARLEGLRTEILRAVARREARAASVPAVRYPPELPVSGERERIVGLLRTARALVVCGETGSGKSTQIPKMCLEAGRGVAGLIGHTQPRRIAARGVAARLAGELGVGLGTIVGFQTRFDARLSPETLVKVMTDGILLAETRRDRGLHRYDTVIVDEAHERSLNIDFLLGHLRRLLDRRDDLVVVVTSATLEAGRVAAFLGDAPVVEVSGRGFPIESRFRDASLPPLEPDDEDPRFVEALVAALEEVERTPAAGGGPRNSLVFLSGERAIREASDAVRGRFPDAEVLPLHGRLPAAEQDRVFAPGPRRRIVLATNVAETSLTVPGIDAVVDGGLARISRFSVKAGVQRLPIEPIARSNAEQRKGRAGRTAPGLCIRLYSEADFLARPAFTPPEIRRTNLASVILAMLGAGLGRPETFPFLDPPSPGLVAAGYRTLFMLGAVDARNELTPLGQRLARLPVDPRIGRIALAGLDERCPEEALVIAAALSVQDPRERPADRAGAADLAHAAFRDPDSDFLGWIRLWKAWREASASSGSSALRRWCRERFLSAGRLREWSEVHRQLRTLVHERILPIDSRLADAPDEAAVHRAVLAGLVGNVARRGGKGEWRTAAGVEVFLHPSSTLVRRNPTWIVAAEIVETSRRFARTVGRIQPDWIERIAPQLCERRVSEPHWVEATGQVAAWERVAFGGLTLIPRRRVPYGPRDPEGSRNIFLHALVVGRVRTDGAFLAHNRGLRERIERLEERRRRRGLLVDDEARFAFYERTVPPGIHSGPSFERWRREAEAANPGILRMGLADLLRPGAELPDESLLPDRIGQGGASLELVYRHEPGTARDGIAVRVPAAAAAWLDTRGLEWLVPGRLAEKVEALIRTLPKRIRTRFQPAAEYAAGAAEALPFGEGELLPRLARHLSAVGGIEVFPRDFDRAALPEHLLMLVEVVGDDGSVLASGRDAAAIAARFRPGAERLVAEAAAAGEFGPAAARLAGRALDDLDPEPLPTRATLVRGGFSIQTYPALAPDADGSVRLVFLDDSHAAERSHAEAVRRLLARRGGEALGHHLEYLPELESMERAYAPLGGPAQFRERLADAAVAAGLAWEGLDEGPRDAGSLAERSRRLDSGWFRSVRAAADRIGPALEAFAGLHAVLREPHPADWGDAIEDLRRELDRLAREAFAPSAPAARLEHLPRRLAALRSRLRRLPGGLERDRALRAERDARLARRDGLVANGLDATARAALEELLEEHRVHLFAGELRTAVPAGAARVDEALDAAAAARDRPAAFG
jgi:ATP-dependent helicase HrpA